MEKKRQNAILLKARIEDGIKWVQKTNTRKFFQFLDPSEQELCEKLLHNQVDVQLEFFGGHEYCERKMLCVLPSNDHLTIWEWPIVIFHLKPQYKEKKLRHSDVLGALMSLGIRRDRIGDINIMDDLIQIFVMEELKGYIDYNLSKISNVSVEIEKKEWKDVIPYQSLYKEIFITVTSLRADSIISKIFGLSRKESLLFIQSGRVKINWKYITTPSVQLTEKDVISVRGKGRATLYKTLGNTKKGNIKVLIRKNK